MIHCSFAQLLNLRQESSDFVPFDDIAEKASTLKTICATDPVFNKHAAQRFRNSLTNKKELSIVKCTTF